MIKVMNQLRRLYDDHGSGDHDFTKQEERLKEAQDNLSLATDRLIKSSEQLNAAAISSFMTKH